MKNKKNDFEHISGPLGAITGEVYKRAQEQALKIKGIGEEERTEYIASLRKFQDHAEGKCDLTEARIFQARTHGKWLASKAGPATALPRDLRRVRIVSYMHAKRNQQARRLAKASGQPMPESVDEDEHDKAMFHSWYLPIETHQLQCENWFMRLAAWGDVGDLDLMRSLFQHGQLINDDLILLQKSEAIGWLPPFTFAPPKSDEQWRRELIGRAPKAPLGMRYADVTSWWANFAKAHRRFYPAELELPIEPVEPPPEPEPIPPEPESDPDEEVLF